jgi:two-component system, sensor histidine kinase and response regulator
MPTMRQTSYLVIWTIAAGGIVLLAVDVAIAMFLRDTALADSALAGGLAYLGLVAVAHVWGTRQSVLWTAVFAVALIAVGFFASPARSRPSIAAINRSVSILSVLLATGLSVSAKRAESHERSEDERTQNHTAEHRGDEAAEAEHALSRRLAQPAAILESSADAIISRDLEGRVRHWNAGAASVYGYSAPEAVGKPISLILPLGQETEEKAITTAIAAGRSVRQFETVRRRKDGELIFVSLTASPIFDDAGNVVGTATIERDCTDRRLNEEQLRAAKDAADEARGVAEQATRARSDFLANVSHELRTPMNSILGMAQLALQEDLSETLRGYLETSYESAQSLLTLLNDILDFAKLESGKFTVDLARFELRDAIEETVRPLASSAFDKGLELVCAIDPETPLCVVGDAVRLRQVLTNLITNAIKFTERGEVSLEVRVVEKWSREVRLEFAVVDTGVGIAEKNQARMLEPFTQVDTSSTRRFGGTGLGLAICNELLRLMGGQLAIQSQLGKGSKFSFMLSLPRQPVAIADTVDAAPFVALRNVRVLVVDDNATNRRIMHTMLRYWRATVDVAADAEEALGKLQLAAKHERPYELVILDALMPGVDGYELSRRIVAECGVGSPVLLMASSSDRRQFRDKEAGLPIAAYLGKPVLQNDLLRAIMVALEEAPPPLTQIEVKSVPAASRRPLSILVVEDTQANQQVVGMVLRKRGHSVAIAQNGREAVDKCREGRFDVILMDIQMPIMDGFQATASIRKLEGAGWSSVPIVAMTAHAMRGDREKCLAAGMDSYISKPIDVHELVEVVEEFSRHNTAVAPVSQSKPMEQGVAADASQRSQLPVLDISTALKRLGDDRDLYGEMVQCFLEDAPPLVETMSREAANAPCDALVHAAHSLKGLAATVGAEELSAAAADVQNYADSHDGVALDRMLDRVNSCFGPARSALAELQASQRG